MSLTMASFFFTLTYIFIDITEGYDRFLELDLASKL